MVSRMASMAFFTTSMPTPRPETLDTDSVAETPLSKIMSWTAASDGRSEQTAPPGRRENTVGVQAASVIGDGDLQSPRDVHGAQRDRSARGLPGGRPHLGRLDSVIDGVANHVEQGIA